MSGSAPQHTPIAPAVRRARLAVGAIFLVNGLALGSWFPHIADVQIALGLSEGVLGLALLAVALGSLVAIPTSGILTVRLGSRPVTRLAALALVAVLPLPLLAADLALLVPALALLGMANGGLDVAMNAQAVMVEERYGRPIMSALHGLFSIGGLIGAVGAGLAMAAGIAPLTHLLVVAGMLGAITMPALGVLLPTPPAIAAAGPIFVLPRGRLALLGLLALCALMAEGAMGDWTAVYLRGTLGTDATLAALGFAAFSLTMTAGRLTGNRLVARYGPGRVLVIGSTVATALLALALLLAHPVAALLGFAGVGLGLANAIPILFSAAGRLTGVPPGVGIAAVSTAGYCGFLVGPPLIGLVGEVVGLSVGLALVAVALAVIATGARALRGEGVAPGWRRAVPSTGSA